MSRIFKCFVLFAALAATHAQSIAADAYPTRNARFIIPFAPGGTNDVLARMISQHLAERWGRAFIVENRPGAGGVIANVNITHVPFKGGVDNMTALLGGQVHMNIIQYQANVLELIRSGRLRALAVTTDGKRSKSLPDTPSMSEAGVNGMAIYVWGGVLGPAHLPAAITHKLQAEIARMLASPAVKERFAAQDAEMIGSRPDEFAKVVQSEIRRWREVIQSAGITAQ